MYMAVHSEACLRRLPSCAVCYIVYVCGGFVCLFRASNRRKTSFDVGVKKLVKNDKTLALRRFVTPKQPIKQKLCKVHAVFCKNKLQNMQVCAILNKHYQSKGMFYAPTGYYNGGFNVLNLISLAAAAASTSAYVVLVVRIVLAVLCLISAGFIIFVVMKQSGNTDGMEAMMGSSKSSDESETYYGKNAGARSEAKLKMWTYICAGVLAVSCIVMIILATFVA